MSTGRWVPTTAQDDAVMSVLQSVLAFSDAMERMHSGMKGEMEMNATDVAALRMLVVRERRGEPVSPHDLARHLRISTASTTKLLDRLTASGHVERLPHPHDRRGRIIVLTEESRAAFYRTFGERMRAMRGVAQSYDDDELALVARFLGEMAVALDPE